MKNIQFIWLFNFINNQNIKEAKARKIQEDSKL